MKSIDWGKLNPPEHVRAYIYRVLLFGVFPAVIFYGLASENEVALWTGIVGEVLQVYPAKNTSTKKPAQD